MRGKGKLMKTYTIKPFNWIESTDYNDCKTYMVNVPFGYYRVTELSADTWRYEYCFDEYYDESYGGFSTETEVKEGCWRNWLSWLEPALEVKE